MFGYEFSGYKLQMKFVSTFGTDYAAIGKPSEFELLDCSFVLRLDFEFPKSTGHSRNRLHHVYDSGNLLVQA